MTMTTTIAEGQMAGIERRLDYIVEELAQIKRVRTQAENLISDLPLVVKDAFGEATTTLGTINLRAPEIVQLLKTALLDAKLLTAAVQQLESANDFIADVQPVVRDVYQQAVAGCQVLQEKGYFEVASAGIRIGDSLVKSISVEDLKQAEASVPRLIAILRPLFQPVVLEVVESIMHGFGSVQATMNVNKSIFEILREMNSPDARRGVAILVAFLKLVGSSTAAGPAGAQTLER